MMRNFGKAFFVFMLSLVLLFSTNPLLVRAESSIQGFFGGNTGLFTDVGPDDTYDTNKQEGVSDHGVDGGFLDFLSRLFGFNKKKMEQRWRGEADTGSLVYFGGGDVSSDAQDEYVGPEPTLTCLPRTVEQNEPVLIFWQCLDSSQTASATGFSTGGKPYGSIQVNPSTDTVYSLSCSVGTYAECDAEVINPALALTVGESSVAMWEKVGISWSAIDMQSCELNSNDDNSKYKDWKRSGVCEASSPCTAISHPITKTTIFTLTCTTLTGLERETSVTVSVQ